jgi:steroid delta-isomerase-like uncharacterized protein
LVFRQTTLKSFAAYFRGRPLALLTACSSPAGPEQTAERYRKHWEGFPDFTVRVRRVLCADESCVVTENEWRGTHLGTFLGWPATGKPVRMRAIVVWHFKGDELWGETIFFDNASLLQQIGAKIDIPPIDSELADLVL